MKDFFKKLFFLPPWGVAICSVLTVVFMLVIFGFHLITGTAAVPFYFFSAYSLVVLVLTLRFVLHRMERFLRRVPVIDRLYADRAFRTSIFFAIGGVFNAFFILFYLYLGIRHRSLWFGAIAFYDLILFLLKLPLTSHQARKLLLGLDAELQNEWKLYRLYGYLMLLLNLAIGIITYLMVMKNQAYEYGFYKIFAIAFYAFYCLILALVNYFRYRRRDDPVVLAMRSVNLAAAMENLYAMQTGMLAIFEPLPEYRKLFNSETGIAIFVLMTVLSFVMILRGRKHIK